MAKTRWIVRIVHRNKNANPINWGQIPIKLTVASLVDIWGQIKSKRMASRWRSVPLWQNDRASRLQGRRPAFCATLEIDQEVSTS